MLKKPRTKSIITHSRSEDGNILTFHVQGCPDIVFDKTKVAAALRARAENHGWFQRIDDAAALSRNTADGKAAPAEAKRAAMAKVAEHYLNGAETWELPRVAPTGGGLDATVIAAVAEGVGRTSDEVRAMVAAGAAKHGVKPSEYLARLATADRVKIILERMRAEQAAAANIDADADLDAMMQAGDGGDDEGEGEDDDTPTDEALM